MPSISFASSHLLSLLAAGRVTGLVLDCGHLESTTLPVSSPLTLDQFAHRVNPFFLWHCEQIYSSRPLFPNLRTTPLAGARLSSHLRALLLLFGTYLPPPTSLSGSVNIPPNTRSTRVPEEVLTDTLIEELKTRCCFVGEPLDNDAHAAGTSTPTDSYAGEEMLMSDPAVSESEYSRVSRDVDMDMDMDSNFSSSQQAASSGFSVVSHSQIVSNLDRPRPGESHIQALSNLYTRYSTATDLRIRVEPPHSQQAGTGRGTLIVPGWIRERAAEVLFEGGDVDESSVAEVILDSLLKVCIGPIYNNTRLHPY